jgi:single-stranded-DNA-specific exonuclease
MEAIAKNQKIMIFGDYDVDGVTSSWIVYKFFHKWCNYKKVSVRLPNRLEDGYGIKSYHLDEIKSC